MITADEAVHIAQAYLAELQDKISVPIEFNHKLTSDLENGYLFFYNTIKFWETGDPSESLDGNEPLFVSKRDGSVKEVPMIQFISYEKGDKSAIT